MEVFLFINLWKLPKSALINQYTENSKNIANSTLSTFLQPTCIKYYLHYQISQQLKANQRKIKDIFFVLHFFIVN